MNETTKPEIKMNEIKLSGKLVDADGLLAALFTDECRPSLRWLRTQTKEKAIPYVRIGHLIFFDVELVKTAIANQSLIRGRFIKSGK